MKFICDENQKRELSKSKNILRNKTTILSNKNLFKACLRGEKDRAAITINEKRLKLQ